MRPLGYRRSPSRLENSSAFPLDLAVHADTSGGRDDADFRRQVRAQSSSDDSEAKATNSGKSSPCHFRK